jgi:hypothetical protein
VYPNGSVDAEFWWTGVLGTARQFPANLVRGLSIIINPLIRLPWVFERDGVELPVPTWVRDPMLLNESNPAHATPTLPKMSRESRFDFWSRWVRDAILSGQATFSFAPDAVGQPVLGSMRRHDPPDLTKDATTQEIDAQWSLVLDGDRFTVDRFGQLEGHPEHRRLHFMRGHQGGILGAHRAELAAAAGVTDYAATLFDGNVPSGVLTTDQPVNQDQADFTREQWEARQWRRRIAVLGNGVKYQQVTMSPVDAAIGQMMMLSNTQVAHMLELPAGMLDGESGGSMTYANINDARRDFVDGTLASWASRIEESVSAMLPWGQSMRIDFTEYTKPLTPQPAAAADALPPVTPPAAAAAPEEVPENASDSA